MNLTKSTKCQHVTVVVAFLFVFFMSGTVSVQANQQSSEELLLKIMDLHSELVSNEIFLAQAKLLGAYVETAQPMNEQRKVEVYTKILSILSKITLTPIEISTDYSGSQMSTGTQFASTEKEESKSVYEPGAALLEIFKADSFETIPALPVIRTYWNRELTYTGGFLIPERAMEIGKDETYVARFSFYFEAKESGKYSFSAIHAESNYIMLTISGINVFKSSGNLQYSVLRGRDNKAAQGVCKLEKGFHRLEFYLFAKIDSRYRQNTDERGLAIANFQSLASFQVKVLTPGGFDAVPITKNMMLLKKQ